ncbi:MAG: type II secretion system GspH family protein [Actinobacteria bacterium]|nr:type II secretion system GspH family protein [Actinomycetota bacterium]
MKQKMLPGDTAIAPVRENSRQEERDDGGFSLVEIVIAMLLFALLAVGILPLLVSVTQLTVGNSESVRGKAAVQQKLASIQRYYPTDASVQVEASRPVGQTRNCSALPTNVAPLKETVGDLTVTTAAGACPTVFPGTVSVNVTVTNSSQVKVASANTSVRVTQ